MNFEYSGVSYFTADIEIDKIGNCCIEATTRIGALYYLIIKTEFGSSDILEFGPVVPDMKVLPKTVNCSYRRINFTESKIAKVIASFLNDFKKEIFQAREVEVEEALNNFPKIAEYFGGLYERPESSGLDRQNSGLD